MKCNICGKDKSKGKILYGSGFVCSGKCESIAHEKRKAHHESLMAEGINSIPDKLETHDFERWALKFAVCWLHEMPEDARAELGNRNPILLVPEHLADEFKERILKHIHPAYVSEIEYRGHQRVFNNGEYCFRQPVPAEHIIEACRKAGLISE